MLTVQCIASLLRGQVKSSLTSRGKVANCRLALDSCSTMVMNPCRPAQSAYSPQYGVGVRRQHGHRASNVPMNQFSPPVLPSWQALGLQLAYQDQIEVFRRLIGIKLEVFTIRVASVTGKNMLPPPESREPLIMRLPSRSKCL